MEYLFSNSGKKFLKTLSRNDFLFAFDYDGTLAPYFPDPVGDRIPKNIFLNLSRLEKVRKLAVISGRAVNDLRGLLYPLKPRYIVGNHGSEGLKIKGFSKEKSIRECKRWIRRISASEVQGVVIENKVFTLSLHYKNAVSPVKAKKHILKVVERLVPPPRIVFGKKVINLLPQEAPNKGDSVLALLNKSRLKGVIYFGDDLTDEDVFCLKNRGVFGVRVGKNHKSRASYYIKNQREINRVITEILKASCI